MGSGKLTDQQEIHTLPAGDFNLVFLQDSLSGRRFLVDTGASISVLPQNAPTLSAPLSKTADSLPVILLCLVLVLVLYLYVLVLDTSPGLSS